MDLRARLSLLGGALGVSLAGAFMYAHAWADDRLPTSHPWGGVALGIAAVNLVLHGLRPASVPAESPRYLVAAVALGASGLGVLAIKGM